MKLEPNHAGRKLSARQPCPFTPFDLLDQPAFNFFRGTTEKLEVTRAAKIVIVPPKSAAN